MIVPEITTTLDVQSKPGGLLLADAVLSKAPIMVSPLSAAPLFVEGKPYRGTAVVLGGLDGTLSVINVLDLEQYLYGVVPSEMPASWPQPALEAQAIVARSYALARSGGDAHPMYDVEAGEGDQVYGGINAEAAQATAAVEATRNIVLVYERQIATTYYSACDGGFTSSGDALDDPQPYLRARADPYCALSPYMQWNATILLAHFRIQFEKVFASVGAIVEVRAGRADASGRLRSVTIVGSQDTFLISGSDFRLFAGQHDVKSLRIATIQLNGDHLFITGSGYGHGVGMCQYGARGMAAAGFAAADILRFYYRGAQLGDLGQFHRSE
jgi:stage II sporulation protein D